MPSHWDHPSVHWCPKSSWANLWTTSWRRFRQFNYQMFYQMNDKRLGRESKCRISRFHCHKGPVAFPECKQEMQVRWFIITNDLIVFRNSGDLLNCIILYHAWVLSSWLTFSLLSVQTRRKTQKKRNIRHDAIHNRENFQIWPFFSSLFFRTVWSLFCCLVVHSLVAVNPRGLSISILF